MGTKLRFVLLLLCLPTILAYPRPPGEEGNEEDRTEGTDDGEVDEEDDLVDKEFSPPDHNAGAPEHGQLVCICMRVYVRFVLVFQHDCCTCVPVPPVCFV